MHCINHADHVAVTRCAGCAEPLCVECHVEIAGGVYCADCKQMAVKVPPASAGDLELEVQGRNGVFVALVGLVVLTPICGVAAIVMGFKARGEIADNPRLCGEGMAYAAIVLGGIDMALFIINLMTKDASR